MRRPLIILAVVISLCAACTWEGDPAVPVLSEIGDRDLLDCSSAESLEESILLSVLDRSPASFRDLRGRDQECADAYVEMCEAVDEASDPRILSACGE